MEENNKSKEEKILHLVELIETNSIALQNNYNKALKKPYRDLIGRYQQELAEVVGFKSEGKKISAKEGVNLYFSEKMKIIEMQKQLQLEEEKKRRDTELGKNNIILMLAIHRDFAKECVFGNLEILSPSGSDFLISEKFEKLKDCELIDYAAFSRFMITDKVIRSYTEDIRVSDFAYNLIERYEYNGEDLKWNISMIDIEILFHVLRENMFIAPDTPRNIFFEMFNPNLSIFKQPIEWKDVKELIYFLNRCRDWEIITNTKYQSLIERYKMFKTQNSKGNYLKSNSIRTTLSDLKNGILETEKFKQRALLIDNFMENFTL